MHFMTQVLVNNPEWDAAIKIYAQRKKGLLRYFNEWLAACAENYLATFSFLEKYFAATSSRAS